MPHFVRTLVIFNFVVLPLEMMINFPLSSFVNVMGTPAKVWTCPFKSFRSKVPRTKCFKINALNARSSVKCKQIIFD